MRNQIVFVPVEDEDGYRLFRMDTLPRVGDTMYVDPSINEDEENYVKYEVVNVAHYVSRKIIEEGDNKPTIHSEYDAIVTGRLVEDAKSDSSDARSGGGQAVC